MKLTWKKNGRWVGMHGPSYTAVSPSGARYSIAARRWRCGPKGRRGYLLKYQVRFAAPAIGSDTVDAGRERHTLKDAKAEAEKHLSGPGRDALETRRFSYVEFAREHHGEAYSRTPGVWRWCSNDAIVPLDAARDYGIPIDADAQRAALDADHAAFAAEYRRRQPAEPSAEELYEMRAAFGPGATVVDIVSGRRTHT